MTMSTKKVSLDDYLKKIINESLDTAKSGRKLAEADKPKSVDADVEKLKKGQVDIGDVVEKLNSIRSGRSFKDSKIMANLTKYVSDLSETERTALGAFLKGISQIVTGEVSPDAAVDPSDKPVGVKMEKTSPEKIVVKTKLSTLASKKAGKEDTSGPVPISPKK